MFLFKSKPIQMVAAEKALPGRPQSPFTQLPHVVLQHPLVPPFPDGCSIALLGMGCFWGAERLLWSLPGVYVTAVGYAGGFTPHPLYEEVCSGMTGHAEVTMVVYFEGQLPLERLLRSFWESHDPTAGMQQGNDRGTQYRSVLWLDSPERVAEGIRSRQSYQEALDAGGRGRPITTEIGCLPEFYYAEPYHQQYLAKNPEGYCGLKGLGIPLNPEENVLQKKAEG